MLCHVGNSGKIVIFAIFAKFASIANFYGLPHCFVLCLVGDCGNIVILAIFAKFASIANFYGPPYCFVLCPVGDCGKIVIFAKFAIMFSFLPFLLLRAFLDISVHFVITGNIAEHGERVKVNTDKLAELIKNLGGTVFMGDVAKVADASFMIITSQKEVDKPT